MVDQSNSNNGRDDSFHGGPDDLGGWKPGPIGKGNPPRKTRFAPGHKRSRGKRNRVKTTDIAQLYREEGAARIKLPSGKSIETLRAIIKRQHLDALKGRAPAIVGVISANMKLNPPTEPEGQLPQLTDKQQAAVDNFLVRKKWLHSDGEGA